MRRVSLALAAAVGAALLGSPVSAQVTIYSFESGIGSWIDDPFDPGTGTLSTSTTGATDGVQSMQLTKPGGFQFIQDGFASFSLFQAELPNNDFIEFDVTIPPSPTFQSDFWGVRVAFNDNGGFRQSPDQFFGAAPGTFTVSFNYRSFWTQPSTWEFFGLYLAINTNPPNPSTLYIDNIRLRSAAAGTPTWNLDFDGDWSQGGNWTGGASPNGETAAAKLGNIINAPTTVNLDVPVTLDRLEFESSQPYTISGGNALTFAGAGSIALITSAGNNSHEIAVPVVMNKSAAMQVTGGGSTIALSGGVTGSGALSKTGDGVLAVKHVRTGGLAVDAGTVRVIAGGGVDGTSVVASLSVAPGAALELNDHDLIVDYPAPASEGSPQLDAVKAAIASGYAGGAWTGSGIRSANADAATRGLGYAEASDLGVGSFSGQSVDATAVLVTLTFYGDANLDGAVDVTDLGSLASGWQLPGDWIDGDFNYDGTVDVADLGALATNWQAGVTGPAADASLHRALIDVGLGALVPEPASLSLVALGALTLRCRR